MMAGAAILSQLIGLAILVAGVALAWRQRRAPFGPHGGGLALTLILTMVGGLAGAPFWWMDYPASFSWDLPPLASRLLASAAVAFGVAGIVVLRQPERKRVQLYLAMLATYLAPLVAAILVFHLDRFDWRAPITYAFLLVAGGLALAALWHLWRGSARHLTESPGEEPPVAISLFLLAVAMVTGLWGLALYGLPGGPLALVWIWPADALTSRLIGTMLLTLAVMCLMARRDMGQARLALIVLAVYGAGAVAAGAMNGLAAKPLPLAYMAGLGTAGLVALILLTSQRR